MGQLPITNGFYISDSLPISHQECTNFYPNIVQTQGLSQETLFGTPGTTQIGTTGLVQQKNRGSWVKNGIPYCVNGGTLYVIERTITDDVESFAATTLGSIEGTSRVSMADNGTQLMILVPGGKGYIYNEDAGTPFAEITDADFIANGAPQYVVFNDGYFVVTTDSKKWIISALNDGLAWDALDFGSAESDPDAIVAPITNNNQVYITGSETTEGFQNVPEGATFPYQRNNVFLEKGCDSPLSLIRTNQTFFMIGSGKDESPAIWQFTGNNFQKVSTTAIDILLQDATDTEIENAFSWYYSQNGSFFVGFVFSERCFVYELGSKRWHERKSTIDEAQTKWRVSSLVSAYGRVIVFDCEDGRIGSLETDVYTEYEDNIIRVFSTQPFLELESFSIPKLELTVESGVGNGVVNPQISLAISKDAKTFNYERIRSIGKIGEFFRRVIWRKNGRIPRFAVLRFRLSDPIKPVIIRLDAT